MTGQQCPVRVFTTTGAVYHEEGRALRLGQHLTHSSCVVLCAILLVRMQAVHYVEGWRIHPDVGHVRQCPVTMLLSWDMLSKRVVGVVRKFCHDQ